MDKIAAANSEIAANDVRSNGNEFAHVESSARSRSVSHSSPPSLNSPPPPPPSFLPSTKREGDSLFPHLAAIELAVALISAAARLHWRGRACLLNLGSPASRRDVVCFLFTHGKIPCESNRCPRGRGGHF